MKYIYLTRGYRTKVDDEDYKWLSQHKWYTQESNGINNGKRVAAIRRVGDKKLYMSRAIMNPPEGLIVDHINRDSLDNRRINLRIVTNYENNQNRKMMRNNTSGYRGVSWNKRIKKWTTYIRNNDKQIYLGAFVNKKDAARTYNQVALKYRGEFAILNKI